MKVVVCFKCKEFIFVGENYSDKVRLKRFQEKHALCPRQVVDDYELNEVYRNIEKELDKYQQVHANA